MVVIILVILLFATMGLVPALVLILAIMLLGACWNAVDELIEEAHEWAVAKWPWLGRELW